MQSQEIRVYSSIDFLANEGYSDLRLELMEILGTNYYKKLNHTTEDVSEKKIENVLSDFPIVEILPFIEPLYEHYILGCQDYDTSKKTLIYEIKSWIKNPKADLVFLSRQVQYDRQSNEAILKNSLKYGGACEEERELTELTEFLSSRYKQGSDLKIAEFIHKLNLKFEVLSEDKKKAHRISRCFDYVNNYLIFKNVLIFGRKISESIDTDWHSAMALLWLILPTTYGVNQIYDKKITERFKKNLGVNNLNIDEVKYIIGLAIISYKLFLKSIYDKSEIFSKEAFIDLLKESTTNKDIEISIENQRVQIDNEINLFTKMLFIDSKESLRYSGDLDELHEILKNDFIKILGLFLKMTTGLELNEYLAAPEAGSTEKTNALDRIIDRAAFSYSTVESLDLCELNQVKLFLKNITPRESANWSQSPIMQNFLELICQNSHDLDTNTAVFESEFITNNQADKLLKTVNLAIENQIKQTLTEATPEFNQTVLNIQDLWLQSCTNLSTEQQKILVEQVTAYLNSGSKKLLFSSTNFPSHTASFFNLLNQALPGFLAMDSKTVSFVNTALIPDTLTRSLLSNSLNAFSAETGQISVEPSPQSITQLHQFFIANNIQTNLSSSKEWNDLFSNSGGETGYVFRKIYYIMKDILKAQSIDNFRSGVAKREFAYGKTEKLKAVSNISGFNIPQNHICLRLNIANRIVIGEELENEQKHYRVYLGNYHGEI
jgi:hypothetical protein